MQMSGIYFDVKTKNFIGFYLFRVVVSGFLAS